MIESIELSKKMEKYEISWFEEPISPEHYKQYKELRRAAKTIMDILSTGESEGTTHVGHTTITDDKYGKICFTDIGYLYDGLNSIINYGDDE